jgi:iron complex outermembrane receptor protein
MGRGGAYVEVQHRPNTIASFTGALRVDRYSAFGSAVSPAAGLSVWASRSVRLRSSIGRAFRAPTFTERFYRDPAHQASADLDAERAWSVDAAVDWLAGDTWMVTAGGFDRHEQDVIDWVRERPSDLWETTNIIRVRASGLELGLKRVAGTGWLASADYTWLSSTPDALDRLSKYTSDYARHALTLSAAAPLPARFSVGGRVDVRGRTGRDAYTLVDVRVARDLGPFRLFLDANNLFDARYEEIRGIVMPGRWLSAGLEVLRW